MSNHYPRAAAALFYGIAALTACAGQTHREVAPAPATALGVIGEEDIARSHGMTVYEVINRVRPMYLLSQLDMAPTEAREVYLNGVRLGGVDQLRLIPASEVKEIRFVRATDGGAYGVSRSGGAIVVISKVGR